MLPAQDVLTESGIGNLIALPLQGKALENGNSAFIDSNWNAYPDQWKVLWSKPKLFVDFIEAKLNEWAVSNTNETDGEDTENRNKPWERKKYSTLQMWMGN